MGMNTLMLLERAKVVVVVVAKVAAAAAVVAAAVVPGHRKAIAITVARPAISRLIARRAFGI